MPTITKTLSEPSTGTPISPMKDTTSSVMPQIGKTALQIANVFQKKQQREAAREREIIAQQEAQARRESSQESAREREQIARERLLASRESAWERQELEQQKQEASREFAQHGEKLRSQAEVLGEAFVNQTIPEFDKELGRLVAGQKQGNVKTWQLKLMAEKLLKTYSIDRTPEQRQKLRQIMGQALGFDPTGAAISLEKERQIQEAKLEADRRDRMISKGFDPDDPNDIEDYEDYQNLLQETNMSTLRVTRETNKQKLKQINAPEIAQKHASVLHTEAIYNINGLVMKYTGKKNIGEVTPDDLKSIDPQKMAQFVYDLDRIPTMQYAQMRDTFGGKGVENDDLRAMIEPLTQTVNSVKGLFNKTTTSEQVAAHVSTQKALTEKQIYDVEKAAIAITMAKNGLEVPVGLRSEIYDIVLKAGQGKSIQPFPGVAGEDSDTGKQQRQLLRQTYLNISKHLNLIEGKPMEAPATTRRGIRDIKTTDVEIFKSTLKGMTNGTISSWQDMNTHQRDSIISLLQDKDFATAVTKFTDDAAIISTLAESFIDNTVLALSNRIIEEERKSGRGGGQMRQMSTIGSLRQISKFKVTSNGISLVPTTDNPYGRSIVSKFNENYVKRINSGLRALANMENRSMKDVINDISDQFIGIPGLSDLFKKEAE